MGNNIAIKSEVVSLLNSEGKIKDIYIPNIPASKIDSDRLQVLQASTGNLTIARGVGVFTVTPDRITCTKRCIASAIMRMGLVSTSNSIGICPRLIVKDSTDATIVDIVGAYDPSNYANRENISFTLPMNVGDYVELLCYQDHSGNRSITAGALISAWNIED